MKQDKVSIVRLIATGCAFLFVLSGCLDHLQDAKTAQGVVGDDTAQMVISGSVGDGPVVNGSVVLRNASNEIIASQTSDDSARYEMIVGILPDSEFPLTVEVTGGTDLVTGTTPEFPLQAAITMSGAGQVANLNPMGTLSVMIAKKMSGGLTDENLAAATGHVRDTLAFGLDTAQFPDFIATDVMDDNVTQVVRSSEALGEAIRRTRDALISTGITSADQVMEALSADLVDGVLDGRGVFGVDSRITAVANVVSAQVALETMANRLEVGGVVATASLDEAIQRVTPNNPAVTLTESLVVTDQILTQTRILLDAALQIDSNADLLALRQAVDQVESGQTQQDLPAILQNGSSEVLDATVQQVSVAPLSDLVAINDSVRDGINAVDQVINHAPIIDGTPVTQIIAGSLFDFTPTAGDLDNDTLTFSISGRPSWADFDSATGRLSGTPGEVDVGSAPGIRITVSDGNATATLPAFDITVSAAEVANRTPTISGSADDLVNAGSTYTFRPTASDPDNDVLTFWISGKPSWASFDAQTGLLSGTPDESDVGSYSGIRVSVSDESGASAALPAFSITVASLGTANNAPVIGGSAPGQVTVDSFYSFTPTASDPDNDPLTFRISGKPSWIIFNSNTGNLSGTPGAGDVGSYSGIWITVSDGRSSTTLPAFSITVNALPNRAPTIGGSPATQATAGSPYSFTPTASDPDNDPLTFSISGRPTWANFDPSTGHLSGTPVSTSTWSNIRISVSDGNVSASLPAFSITVNSQPNHAPSISGSPATQVTAGSTYSFTPTATDADNDSLTFSISGKPSWANFDSVTGRLSGTPASAAIWSDIRISVSDGNASASLPAFSITVNSPPNHAPTIGGLPAQEVMVGSSYSFTPMADDPDGDPLTFSISGKPSWANFDSSTGQLSGTPGAGDVSTYAGISISVSDGVHDVSLANFSINVVAQALGSATLTWSAPTLNADGTTLTDLAGYKVYYGTSVDSMTTVETIDNPSVVTYLVENLSSGLWYFKVTAFDSSGNESADSEIGSKLVEL